jgi:hypothetical protein
LESALTERRYERIIARTLRRQRARVLVMARSASACSAQKTSRTPRAGKRDFIFSETLRIFSLCKERTINNPTSTKMETKI